MLFKFFLKTFLGNKSLWGWGVALMVFWIFMGSYVFGFRSSSLSISMYNASVWYAIIALISSSTIATRVSYSIYYANSSLSYAFKYTRLSPGAYVSNLLVSTSVVGGILGSIMLLFTFLFFSSKSGYVLAPFSPFYATGISILSGAFMFLLATMLIIFVNNYMSLRNVSFASFLPTVLTYLFGFSQLGLSLPSYVIYASPFTEISDLLFYSYDGCSANEIMSNISSPHVNSSFLILGLIIWIALFLSINIVLIRRIKPKSIEEARQI